MLLHEKLDDPLDQRGGVAELRKLSLQPTLMLVHGFAAENRSLQIGSGAEGSSGCRLLARESAITSRM